MREPSGVVPRIDAADTEVEFSNQDLLALSDTHSVEPLEQPRPAMIASANEKTPAPSAARRASPLRLSLALAAAVGFIGVTHLLTTSEHASPPTANISQRTAQLEPPAQVQLAKGEPVRFANPFDTKEVFEFPPGTTENQAREAVAEVLMERALSRQQT